MFRSTRLLALVAGTTLAVGAFAGTAGAVDTVDDIAISPCVQNPDLPACQDDDDDDDPVITCFVLDDDCTPEEPEDTDDIPSADPADAVTGSPNFTG